MVKKERNSNIELFRIIVMLLIVAHHYVLGYGSLMHDTPLTAQSWFLYFWGMWGKTGINCFVLITGYYMCKSDITLHKFLKLFLEIEFYALVIYLIFVLTGYIDFQWGDLIITMWPIHNVDSGFVSGFLLYFLFIPFINVLVRNLTQKYHQLLILLSVTVYTLLAKISDLGGVNITLSLNYITWFSIIHIIASYIRFYPPKKENDTHFWGLYTFISVVLSMMSVVAVRLTGMGAYFFVSDSNAPFALLTSICAFMLFKSMKVKQSKLINTIAATTFGVLLIHTHSSTMRQWIWHDLLQNEDVFGTSMCVLHAIFSVLAIFIVCAFIDWLRRLTIEDVLIDVVKKPIQKVLKKKNEDKQKQ